jgi:hypothetical protein
LLFGVVYKSRTSSYFLIKIKEGGERLDLLVSLENNLFFTSGVRLLLTGSMIKLHILQKLDNFDRHSYCVSLTYLQHFR